MATTEALRGGILALNAGSSSIKYAWDGNVAVDAPLRGAVEGNAAAIPALLDDLARHGDLASLDAVGHRVVLSARRDAVAELTPPLLAELQQAAATDPEHLPAEIALMTALRSRCPAVRQFACFDAAFHRTMPAVARTLPIPERYTAAGLARIGFHGLSCAFLMEELARTAGVPTAQGRVIIAHLGGGSSITAVHRGRSIDTSMGFTPTGGVPMATRSGDLDPGVVLRLVQLAGGDWSAVSHILNHESGMLALGGSGDMRQLLARQSHDARAALAVDVFCYQLRKQIGAFAAALDGVDTLIFAGGIGEHAPEIRQRIGSGLGTFGLSLDPTRNQAGEAVVSGDASAVVVRVMHTDEEAMIVRSVRTQIATHAS